MTVTEKIYVFLCAFFAVLVVTGNLISQKFISLSIGNFYTFELSAGSTIYPLTFLITDLLSEFYGKERAGFCVKLAISLNITIACIVLIIANCKATEWSRLSNVEFNKAFGFYSVIFISSIIANYISQSVDIIIYLWIRKVTKGKYLWLRNNVSTATSLFIDTCTVVSLIYLMGAIPEGQYTNLIINSYLFKLFFTISSTPAFYASVYIIRWLKNRDS